MSRAKQNKASKERPERTMSETQKNKNGKEKHPQRCPRLWSVSRGFVNNRQMLQVPAANTFLRNFG
jgi:hypothetical protein